MVKTKLTKEMISDAIKLETLPDGRIRYHINPNILPKDIGKKYDRYLRKLFFGNSLKFRAILLRHYISIFVRNHIRVINKFVGKHKGVS